MLTVIGGTYYEFCCKPSYNELWGSGLRAAAALSELAPGIKLISCIDDIDRPAVESQCELLEIKATFHKIDQTITFDYFHPLSQPYFSPDPPAQKMHLTGVVSDCVLYYGLLEANIPVQADYLVYDPQNGEGFDTIGSTANHLALVLNLTEAKALAKMQSDATIEDMGWHLLAHQNAEVVVIKNGAQGAIVFEKGKSTLIPVFITEQVWPIGSGDIFSAVFAWQWGCKKVNAADAAMMASKMTASYCENRILPLLETPGVEYKAAVSSSNKNKVYLAGPFFTTAEIWLIEELRSLLSEFGNDVFSPFHQVGILEESDQTIATLDLEGLRNADVVFAVVTGLDAGTLFEIGYAKALNKHVVVFAENVTPENLLMLRGTGCEIKYDIASAVYAASWQQQTTAR